MKNALNKGTVGKAITTWACATAALFTVGCETHPTASLNANQASVSNTEYFLVGSYTAPETPGVQLLSFDISAQQLQLEKAVTDTINPSYLNWQSESQMLYAIATTTTNEPRLEIHQWQAQQQAFELLHSVPVNGSGICHIGVNPEHQQVAVVNYNSGNSALFDLEGPTQTPVLRDEYQHSGSSLTSRQEAPHLHFAGWGNNNRYLYITDLGTDEILMFDTHKQALKPQHKVSTLAGDGPRHLAFHPSKPWVYSLNELSNSIAIFEQQNSDGTLIPSGRVEVISAANTTPKNTASAIRISPNGKYLYVAIRGENMLYGYSIQDSGELKKVTQLSTGGNHPRDFNFSTSGNYILVANQHSNRLNLIQRNKQTGVLTATTVEASVHKPSFIQSFDNSALLPVRGGSTQ
nr:lactonase family protein [Echinimonas agarilytica]